MQIILLSGGAGKRLWPLSNDLYSKQFLRLLRRADGMRESMIQRVCRQVREVAPDVPVTIATAREQTSLIRRQLARRSIFPSSRAAAIRCLPSHSSARIFTRCAACRLRRRSPFARPILMSSRIIFAPSRIFSRRPSAKGRRGSFSWASSRRIRAKNMATSCLRARRRRAG